jgi:hypothetical protein
MSYPDETWINYFGAGLEWVAKELRQYYALTEGYLSVEHKDSGAHAAVTADSVTVAGAGTFGAGLTAFSGVTLQESGFRSASFLGDPSCAGVLVGGASAGLFLELRAAVSPYTSGNEIALWSLGYSTVKPILRFGSIGGTLTMLDGGSGSSIDLGSTLDPIANVVATDVMGVNGLKERSRSAYLGEWTTVTYSSGNFTTNAGTWTVASGDQTTYSYSLIGKTLLLNLAIETTTVSGAPAQLRVALPAGLTAAKTTITPGTGSDAGTLTRLDFVTTTGATYGFFRRSDLATFANATDTTYAYAQVAIEVQ